MPIVRVDHADEATLFPVVDHRQVHLARGGEGLDGSLKVVAADQGVARLVHHVRGPQFAVAVPVEGQFAQVGKADQAFEAALGVVHHQQAPGRSGKARAHLRERGVRGDALDLLVGEACDLQRAQKPDLAAAAQRDSAPLKLPLEEGTAKKLLGDDRGDGGCDHHRDGERIVRSHFEDDQHGGDGRAQHRAGDRPHADDGVGAVARGERREHRGRQHAERPADHGPQEERGREDPAAEARAQRQGRCHGLH